VGASGATSDPNVRRLQERLRAQGVDPGSIDGVMGQQTQDALREFQRRNGLSETGQLDTRTAEKLGLGPIRP
jgi:peptidoglycan hydrolase-like protein with peptidoglycan-binding domain